MRKLVIILIVSIAVVTFIRALDNPANLQAVESPAPLAADSN